MARKTKKEEYYRFFTVTDPRTHEKGHTEYKVTARFVSKKRPEDVKEVVIWRRYSEMKKLHGELAYTHRNLFRRQEEFPPFPRAQLFGRFDESVIEERRKAAEAMLLFTTNIPALYNSPQLKEFFRGGEVRRPLEPSSISSSSSPLPPPLIPLPKGAAKLGAEEEAGTEAPIQAQELESSLREIDLDETEEAVEALSDMENSPVEELERGKEETQHDINTEQPATGDIFHHLPWRGAFLEVACPEPPASPIDQSEEFDALFDCSLEEPVDRAPPPLSVEDLAIFDPCAKEDQSCGSPDHSELLSLKVTNPDAAECEGYIAQAAKELNTAQEKEKEGEYSAAILNYRAAVDILMKGVQGEVDAQQRDAVKKRIAECLEHAERLLSLHTPTQQHNM
ncbi:sorting nexin-15 isoform X1 [Astyanax mexicanus]|uniref:sorting nexin-15 isoform X1 n=1 Tax=Astyanax mexicanus TaxID=7994 RepID=UPI0020CB2CA2|nr:sorting nexin-15 isoform X1 [Astyanax mexicanus]